jgi:hypothetical protein
MAGELDTPFVPSWLDPQSPASLDAMGTAPSWLAGYEPNVDPSAQLVPGIGVPAAAFDQAAAVGPAEIEMPPMDVSRPQVDPSTGVALGYPHAATDAPPTEAEIAAQNAGPPGPPLVPGIGIPAQVFDQAAGQVLPPPPFDPSQIAPGVSFVQNALSPIEAEQLTPGPNDQLPVPSFAQYGEQRSASPLEDPNSTPEERDAYAQQLALHDPVAFANLQTKHALARENFAATEILKASEDDRRAAEDNLRIQREATAHANAKDAQLMQQAAELSTRPIDPNRWWSSRTTGQKIWNVIGALGGAMSVSDAAYHGQYGMRNQFLDGMQKDIDDDISLQKEAITRGIDGVTQQRGIVADVYRRTGDLYQAGEVARVATLQRARQDVLAKQQLYDPRGTQAIALGQTAQELAMRAAAAQQAAAKAEFDKKKNDLELEKARADIEKTKAETATKLAKSAGTGTSSYAASLENPLLAGLNKDQRERAVFAPDGKAITLANDKDDAKLQRDEIATANGAIGAMDNVIADLTNDAGLMSRIKAKAGLNPEDLAVIRSKLALLKPQITKLASGTNRIPVAEIQAVEHAIDDPSSFTNETLKQLRAIRDGSVDEVVDKFKAAHRGWLTRDSFGHAPKLAEDPDAPQIVSRLTAPPVKGDAGFAKPSAGEFAGSLEQLFRKHVETVNMQGPEQSQKEYLDELDKVETVQHENAVKTAQEAARLIKIKKRTPAQDAELTKAKQASYTYSENQRAIDDYRKKSVEESLNIESKKKQEEVQQQYDAVIRKQRMGY